MTDVYGWHFLAADMRLGYGDGRLVTVGERLDANGAPKVCEAGMHLSVRALDALQYAPGPIACRVVGSGASDGPNNEHPDKSAHESRTVVAMVDATDILREFVRDTLAVRQPHLVTLFERAGLSDHAEAIKALDMERGGVDGIERVMVAARDAARAAAGGAAGGAARAAAWAVARDAARDAVLDAVWAATWAVARVAARDAACVAARAVAWDAARAVAWDAAWAAARGELNARLEARLYAAMGITQEVTL